MTDDRIDEEFGETVDVEITDSLDLHAFLPQDARAVLMVYLSEARDKGFKIVRIIHGKGVGVQREMVRNVLSETEFVLSFKNADGLAGNWGATVATFKD